MIAGLDAIVRTRTHSRTPLTRTHSSAVLGRRSAALTCRAAIVRLSVFRAVMLPAAMATPLAQRVQVRGANLPFPGGAASVLRVDDSVPHGDPDDEIERRTARPQAGA